MECFDVCRVLDRFLFLRQVSLSDPWILGTNQYVVCLNRHRSREGREQFRTEPSLDQVFPVVLIIFI